MLSVSCSTVHTIRRKLIIADQLSNESSIAGLYTLADQLFMRSIRYIKAVKDAKKEAQAICDELQLLAVALHQLYLQASRLEIDDGSGATTSFRPRFVDSCNVLLMELDARLEKFGPIGGHFSKPMMLRRQLRWPFSTSESKSLLETLERHKSTALLALGAENLKAIEGILVTQEQLTEEVREIRVALEKQRAFEIEFQTHFSEKERNEVFSFFSKLSPQKRHRTSKSLRHPNTGLWLLRSDEIQEWLDQGSDRLWLSGIPGAGKTVLASVLIDETLKRCSGLDRGVAYFYCDYKDEQSQDPVNILGSLAVQLAKQSIEGFELLQNLYRQCHEDYEQTCTVEVSSLVDTINGTCQVFRDVFIIVDALDECGKHMAEITKILAGFPASSSGEGPRIAVLSREEEDISRTLDRDFNKIHVAARNGDLRLYVAEEMDKRMKEGLLVINSFELKEVIQERLVAKADGM